MKKSLFTFIWLSVAAVAISARGQADTSFEDGPDGVRWRVTRQVVQRSIPQTEYQAREQKVYHPQITTAYQSYQQTYFAPVTEYQWVPKLKNRFNPFADAYWAHELVPVTRWEAHPTTVQIPTSRTDWIEETRTTQVPVTTYRNVAEEHYDKVPVGVVSPGIAPSSSAATSIASRPIGGQQYQSDPPKSQSPWATSSSGDGIRR